MLPVSVAFPVSKKLLQQNLLQPRPTSTRVLLRSLTQKSPWLCLPERFSGQAFVSALHFGEGFGGGPLSRPGSFLQDASLQDGEEKILTLG